MVTPSRQRVYVIIGAIVVAFFTIGIPLLRWLSGVWIDWLWYGDLGQQQVFVTRIVSQIVTGLVFGLATFLLLYINLRIARGMAPKTVPIGMPEGTPEQLGPGVSQRAGYVRAVADLSACSRFGTVSLQRSTVRTERRVLRLRAAGVQRSEQLAVRGIDTDRAPYIRSARH
jgi:hypothetical protein